jgi:hypothetical protein
MKWTKSEEKMPPLNKKILLGESYTYFEGGIENRQFKWFQAYVERPFDLDKKYNENYYVYIHLKSDISDGEEIWKKRYDEFTLEKYWMEIPESFDIKDRNLL